MKMQKKIQNSSPLQKDKKLLTNDLEEDKFFYKWNVCNFETLFVDQFKQHKKWNPLKSKQKAEMEVNTSSGKRTLSVLANKDKLNAKPSHKGLYKMQRV